MAWEHVTELAQRRRHSTLTPTEQPRPANQQCSYSSTQWGTAKLLPRPGHSHGPASHMSMCHRSHNPLTPHTHTHSSAHCHQASPLPWSQQCAGISCVVCRPVLEARRHRRRRSGVACTQHSTLNTTHLASSHVVGHYIHWFFVAICSCAPPTVNL